MTSRPVLVSGVAGDPRLAPSLRWGVLGAGNIGGSFADAVAQHTAGTVLATGSRDVAKAVTFAARHGIDRAYGSYEELVADPDVDAIYVATPHSHHRDHALLAIGAGKHVLVEKAFTRNAAEARAVIDAARGAGVFAMEAMLTRHLPHVAAIREIIGRGDIGDVREIRAGFDVDVPFDAQHRMFDPNLAGGALLDLGIYPLAFAVDLLGSPDEVRATGLLTSTGVDAQETIVLRYGNHALATLSTSIRTSAPNTATIVGSAGRIEIAERYLMPTTFTVTAADGSVTEYDGRVRDAAGDLLDEGKQFEAAEVARCVAAGLTESPRMTLDQSLELMEIMDSIRAQIGVRYPGE
ncbi:Predicted dehydrogenase [Sanguibacter gelidistatuariae]|uniref:Predicted dehydrogenase n=1 Tax=Sanguibacter gelidistatuariae TaxID=1814289 RepID=A0A1G6HNQ1_9MICO|nr:Gfo/Idh/MocA family oxidoreductase [Sanguibacter gelidistatuariae]SDB95851.1 Predicted dehydrogenase [Sanguibacter gelidistatuariae]